MNNNKSYHVLIIDDEAEIRHALNYLFSGQGWSVSELTSAEGAAQKIASLSPDLVISDVRMPGLSGLDFFASLKNPDTSPPFIFLSAHADVAMAVEAMHLGAYSFYEKPFEPKQLIRASKNAAKQHRLRLENSQLQSQVASLSGLDAMLIGNNKQLVKIKQQIIQFAALDSPILILGDTGTGKQLAASALHQLSPRSNKPFITINCANLTEAQFALALFGSTSNPGYVEKAHGGTIFLDELSALSSDQQMQLLRVIETGEYQHTDSIELKQADLRIVAAVNGDLQQLQTNEVLRKDLIYRIATLTIHMPNLSGADEDIILLFNHYLHHYCQANNLPIPALSAHDLTSLLTHPWPGNVRELIHLAERFVIHNMLQPSPIEEVLSGQSSTQADKPNLRSAVANFERAIIRKVMLEHQGRMDDVAAYLGIGRRTLNEKMVKLNLDRKDIL